MNAMKKIVVCGLFVVVYVGMFTGSVYASLGSENFDSYTAGWFADPWGAGDWTRKAVPTASQWDWRVQIDNAVSYSTSNSLKVGQMYNNWQSPWAKCPLTASLDTGTMTFYGMSSGTTDLGLRVNLWSGSDRIGYFGFGSGGEALGNSGWRGDSGEYVIGNYAADTWYDISISWNGDTEKISFSFDGGTAKEFGYLTSGAGAVDTMEVILHNGATHYYGWVDDINVIPEPATIAILSLGGLALVRRKK